MEAKLNLILKELRDLKLRVNGLESKSNERTLENRNDKWRDESISRSKISEDDIIHRIKKDPPTIDDIIDPKIFSYWMPDLNYYFGLYMFKEKSKIQFLRMRLTRSVKIYWTSIERVHEAWGFHWVLGGNEIET